MGFKGPPATALSSRDFCRLSQLIKTHCGIKMPASKQTMLEARLQKRLRALGLKSFGNYCDYLFSPEGMDKELVHLIDVVTTNKTEFFREPQHFEYLVQAVLPKLLRAQDTGIRRWLRIWSAGCSTGEEPYTLAMVLSEFAERYPGFQYAVLATDISTDVLDKAKLGIYERSRVDPVPMALKKKYLLRNKDESRGLVRIVPELRARVQFCRLNFMGDDFDLREPMDIIFCRNVIIYFDRPTQERILNQLCRYLIPGGYLFLGHSETLSGLSVPLLPAAPTVYRKPV